MSQLPEPPYFAVIFSNQRSADDEAGYATAAARMEELAAAQPGFLGRDTTRGADGHGIAISYWKTREHIAAWKQNAEHKAAQDGGFATWYDSFTITIAEVTEVRNWRREG